MPSTKPQITYLTSIKNLDEMLEHIPDRDSYYNLANSAIQEPIDLLLQHLDQHRPEMKDRIHETNVWGQRTLIKRIAERYRVQPASVLLTTRASDAIFLICQTIFVNGGYAIVESPVYEPLVTAPQFSGAQISFVKRRAENNFQLEPADLERKLEQLPANKPKLIILTNLHNPTGAQLPDETLLRIARLATHYKAWVLIDEIYHDVILDQQKTAALACNRFITVNSFSKIYGLTALRCGWIIASPKIVERIRPIYVAVENDGARLAEALSTIVFENSTAYDAHWSSMVTRNRPIVDDFAGALTRDGLITGAVPRNGCIYFPQLAKVKGQKDMARFVDRLNTKYRVFVGPGHFFRGPGHIRIGFGGDPVELERGLQKLSEAIRRFKS